MQKKIDGYDNYVITNNGQVINTKHNRVLKPTINSAGYLSVTLNKNGEGKSHNIHRLLGEYFISNPENKCCINHKDGNRLNNNLDNLEWMTNRENVQHGCIRRNGKIKNSNLNNISLDKIKELKKLADFENLDLYTLIIQYFNNKPL